MEVNDIWKLLKKTKQRECIYRILSMAEEPMSAADIYQQILTKESDKGYAISTVYRVLQAFEEKNLVNKTSLPDSDMALYEWNAGAHKHYAICLKCHKKIALKECPFRGMHLQGAEGEFMITGHKVEIYGYCNTCYAGGAAGLANVSIKI